MHPSTKTTNESFFRRAEEGMGRWAIISHEAGRNDWRHWEGGEPREWAAAFHRRKSDLALACWLRWGGPATEWIRKDDGVWWAPGDGTPRWRRRGNASDVQAAAMSPLGSELPLPALIAWGGQLAAARGLSDLDADWGPRRRWVPGGGQWNGEGPVPGTGRGVWRRGPAGNGSIAREASAMLLEYSLLAAGDGPEILGAALGGDERVGGGSKAPAWVEPWVSRLGADGRRMAFDLRVRYDDDRFWSRRGFGWKDQGRASQGGRVAGAKRSFLECEASW